MSITTEYRKEIDSFCEETYNVSGEEMLNMAKRSTIKVNDTNGKNKKIKKTVIGLAAACVAITGMTAAAGAAGYGPLSSVFGHYIHDDETAKLAEEGYAFTPEDTVENSANEKMTEESRTYPGLGETVEIGSFSVTPVGLAGDTQSPRILVDLKVNDPELLKKYDHFAVDSKTLGEEGMDMFATQGTDTGIGERDDTQEDLFHISIPIPPYWVTNGEETYFFITSIIGYSGDIMEKYNVSDDDILRYSEHNMDMDAGIRVSDMFGNSYREPSDAQFRFFVPEGTLKEAVMKDYTDIKFEDDGIEYDFYGAMYGAHAVWFSIKLDKVDDVINGDMTEGEKVDALLKYTTAFGNKLTVTVDGVEYKADLAQAYPWYFDGSFESGGLEKDYWYLNYNFDGFDYDAAQSVTISDGTNTYDLK